MRASDIQSDHPCQRPLRQHRPPCYTTEVKETNAVLVIPVLDIKDGVVVHARGGDRAAYRPIETPLAPGRSDPAGVAVGFRRLAPFPVMYVADLDGIGGGARNGAALVAIAAALPGLEIWLDDGRSGVGDVVAARCPGVRPVVGSETLGTTEALYALAGALGPDDWALSLDFREGGLIGPEGVLERSELWPETVIVMTLARDGADAGPDLARVAAIRLAAGPGRQVIAAGGVRGCDDLCALVAAGASGALVASALHAGRIKAGDPMIAGPT